MSYKKILFLSSLFISLNLKSCQTESSWSQAKTAVINDDCIKLDQLLSSDVSLVNHQDKEGVSLLMIAANAGKESVVELLLSKKANVNLTNDYVIGKTAFELAKTKKIVEMLLAAKNFSLVDGLGEYANR